MKKFLLGLTISLLLTSSAMALSIPWTTGEQNTFVDLSAEYLIDGTNANNQQGILDEGDKLRGIFDIDSITSPVVSDPLPNELTGIFEIEVISRQQLFNDPFDIDGDGDGVSTTDYGFGAATTTETWQDLGSDPNEQGITPGTQYTSNLYQYTFGVSSSFESIYGTGALMAVYIDDDFDFVTTGTGLNISTAENNVTDGDIYWTFGLGATGEWTIDIAPEDLEIFKYVDAETTIAGTQVGLNMLTNPIGPDLVDDIAFVNDAGTVVPVDLRANISLNGIGNLITPFDLKNKVDGTLSPSPIPEPATMTLFGIGLLSLAAVSRRRKE